MCVLVQKGVTGVNMVEREKNNSADSDTRDVIRCVEKTESLFISIVDGCDVAKAKRALDH